jgi:nucleotide-binding universal stress UspA family protein
MNRKVLVAVDGSPPSSKAVSYAASAGRRIPDLGFTLYYVLPPVPESLLKEAREDAEVRDEIERLARREKEAGEGILSGYRTRMTDAGLAPDRIDLVVVARSHGVAKAILEFGQEGRYHAILVGRRGRRRLMTVFMGSVTASLLEHSNYLPIWVVDGPVTFRSVLVAVDGSESSLRAVEHLAEMLAGTETIEVTLFHVVPRFGEACPVDAAETDSRLSAIGRRGNQHCIDHFYPKARAALAAAGLSASRVRFETSDQRLSPGKAILEKAQAEEHDTVVIGRRGLSRSFFTGSVSRYVMDRGTGHALWVVS